MRRRITIGRVPRRRRHRPDATPIDTATRTTRSWPATPPVTRPAANLRLPGDVGERLSSGLQSRLHRFESGRRLYSRTRVATTGARDVGWATRQRCGP